jgi:hypothetical protein
MIMCSTCTLYTTIQMNDAISDHITTNSHVCSSILRDKLRLVTLEGIYVFSIRVQVSFQKATFE